MATSKRRLILEAFRDRLALILMRNNYLTDAGETIFLGERPTLGPDDGPAIALVAEEDIPNESQGLGSGGAVEVVFPVSVHALVAADVDEPLLALENVIHDVKRAVEKDDRTLGSTVGGLRRGSVVPLEREEGSTVVGAAVQYVTVYSEKWGDPAA